MMGYVVRSSDAAQACPDWPTCYGQLSFPSDLAARLQMVHRGLAALSLGLIVAATVMAWRRFRNFDLIRRPLSLAVALMALQVGLGGWLVWSMPDRWFPPSLWACHWPFSAWCCTHRQCFLSRGRFTASRRLAFRAPFARGAC